MYRTIWLLRILLFTSISFTASAQQADSLSIITKDPFFDTTLTQFKNSAKADDFFALGGACYDKGEYNKAIIYYDSAIQLKPDMAIAYNNMGNAYHALHRYTLAITCYDKAILLNPNNKEAYCNRANSESHCNMLELAAQDYTMALQLDPKNPINYFNRACFYMKNNNYKAALSDYDSSIALDPGYIYPYNNIAYIHLKQGNFKLAIQGFEKFLAMADYKADGYGNACYDIGYAYFELKKYYKAACWAEIGKKYKADNETAFILYREQALKKMSFFAQRRYRKFLRTLYTQE